MIERLMHSLKNLLGSGKANVTADDGPFQTLQVQFNQMETKDNLPRMTEYGFTSHPPDNHTALVLSFGGNKTTGVVIATHHSESRRKELAKGEVCISDDQGQEVYISRDGITLIDKAGSTVKLNGDGTGEITFAGGLTINANTTVNGTLTASGTITGQGDISATGNISAGSDVQAGSISLASHVHGDAHGGNTTGPISS